MKRGSYIRIPFLMVFLLAGIRCLAQQDPMYSQYMFNGLLINPAYAGSHEAMSATILYRNQWQNIPGAPKTGTLTLDAPLKSEKVGLGLNLLVDKIGITRKTGIMGAYSYKIKFKESVLAAGLQMGYNFVTSDYTSVQYSENGNQYDDAFMQDIHEKYPSFGMGLYYYTNRFYAGLSIPEFGSFFFGKPSYKLDQSVHYFFTSGYVFDLSQDIKFKPSVLAKYVSGAPLTMDFNATAWFFDFFALGASYRSGSSINMFTEIKMTPQLYLGYAYEYAYTDLRNFNTGTHELMLRYDFSFSRSKVLTPRYF